MVVYPQNFPSIKNITTARCAIKNDFENACLICGESLVYSQAAYNAECSGCGQHFSTNTACKTGHFICDTCHGAKSMPVIFHYCTHTDKQNPFIIADEIMQNPAIHMHGPEHHVLIGSALLAAYHNSGGNINLPASLAIMRERGSALPGGICGLWGSCGAGISAGTFMSIITGSTPLATASWRLSNLITSECLKNIAMAGGPRCCKRDGFLAIQAAVEFTAQHCGVYMERIGEIKCGYSPRNKECLKENCLFYGMNEKGLERE